MKTVTVTLTNDFHGTTARVRGLACNDEGGSPAVRISDSAKNRVERKLCGMKGCTCQKHGPHFAPDGNPVDGTTWVVVGE